MAKSIISIAIFNSYFDITRGYLCVVCSAMFSHLITLRHTGEEQQMRPIQRLISDSLNPDFCWISMSFWYKRSKICWWKESTPFFCCWISRIFLCLLVFKIHRTGSTLLNLWRAAFAFLDADAARSWGRPCPVQATRSLLDGCRSTKLHGFITCYCITFYNQPCL